MIQVNRFVRRSFYILSMSHNMLQDTSSTDGVLQGG